MCPRTRDHLGGRNRIKSTRALFLSTDTWTLSTEVWFAAPLNRDQPRKRLLYVDGIRLSKDNWWRPHSERGDRSSRSKSYRRGGRRSFAKTLICKDHLRQGLASDASCLCMYRVHSISPALETRGTGVSIYRLAHPNSYISHIMIMV